MIVPIVVQSDRQSKVRFRFWNADLAKWFDISEKVQMKSGDVLGKGEEGHVVLNLISPWPNKPKLVLKQNPLRLSMHHEIDKRYVVEHCRDLGKWEQRWELKGTGQWYEIEITTEDAKKFFRVRAVE